MEPRATTTAMELSRPSTPKFQQESNSMISSPRSGPSRPSTPTTLSSVTAPRDSISSARASYRFFNSLLRGVYESCVLPTETAFAASHSICSSSYFEFMEPRSSWRQLTFLPPSNVNLQRTFSLSSPFLALVSTVQGAQGEEVDTSTLPPPAKKSKHENKQLEKVKDKKENDPLLRTMSIRLILTSEQREEVVKTLAVQRAAFNFGNDLVRNYDAFAFMNKIRDAWNDWKDGVRQNRFGDSHLHRWIVNSKVHTKIEAQGIRQLCAAYKAEHAKAKKNKTHPHPVRFRSTRKMLKETLLLEKAANGGPCLAFLPCPYVETRRGRARCILKIGGDNFSEKNLQYFILDDKKSVINRLVNEKSPLFDGKIKWDKRLGTFHFIYTYEIPHLPDPDPCFLNKSIVATDPGVYPFQAWYSPTSGEYGRLLDSDTDVLFKRCQALDKLQSRIDRFQGARNRRQRVRTKAALRKRLARDRECLKEWVKAAHYNCIKVLLSKHDIILQPTLETSRLSRRVSRRISSKTTRLMLTWSHYHFVQRLKHASARKAGCHVIECKEPGTSKTCTNCGFWKANLRVQDKRFNCPRCGIVVDRQLAGARNNFLAAYGMAVGVGWDGVDG